jgi:RNA polymerase sigma-70 factor (ECF subfamily)
MVDLGRLWTGDHEYLAELIWRHRAVVKTVCQGYGGSPDEVDDLVQEVWTLVFEKRRAFRGGGSFSAWLYRLATRYCIDVYRKKARERSRKKLLAPWDIKAVYGKPQDPERDLERKEAKRRLWEALDALPEKERECLVLRYLEGRSPAEVAEIMGIEQTSVRSNISRGLRRLRGIMGGTEK